MRKNCSKVVLENFFEPCVLYLLLNNNSYGYELLKQLTENCSCPVNVGNLYRGLARMQKEGSIKKLKSKSKIGPDRYVYEITEKGKKNLGIWISELEEQKNTIEKLIKNYKKFTYDKS